MDVRTPRETTLITGSTIPWTYALRLKCIRLYMLTRLNHKEIAKIIESGDVRPRECAIGTQLKKLLGPRYAWYHVSLKWPDHPLSFADPKSLGEPSWEKHMRNWRTSSSQRVEVRLRTVKDSQATLSHLINGQLPERSHEESNEHFLSVSQTVQAGSGSTSLPSTVIHEMPPVHAPSEQLTGINPSVLTFPTAASRDVVTTARPLSLSAALDVSTRDQMGEGISSSSAYVVPDNISRHELDDDTETGHLEMEHDPIEQPRNILTSGISNRGLSSPTGGESSTAHNTLRPFVLERTLSSRELSQVQSVEQMSSSSSTGNQLLPVRRLDFLKTRMRRIFPTLMPARIVDDRRLTCSGPFDQQTEVNACRVDPFWRSCCVPLSTAKSIAESHSRGEPAAERCEFCCLNFVHYAAAARPLPFQEFESGEASDVQVYDAFGNSPLHFAASRPHEILNTIRYFLGLRGFPSGTSTWREIFRSTNHNMQTFLFTLHPLGLGESLEELDQLLELTLKIDPSFNLSHRDVHGQTFARALYRHPNFPTGSEPWLHLMIAMRAYGIQDCADNLNSTVLPPSTTLFHSEFYWSDPANALESNLHKFDAEGNTILLWLVKDAGKDRTTEGNLVTDTEKIETLVDFVLQHFGNILHFVDRSGESALFIAVKTGQPRLVRKLLKSGARYNIGNYAGVSLLSAARDRLHDLEFQGITTETQLVLWCDILICIILVLDFDERIPLPPSGHIFRGEVPLATGS
ncbi:MAG: hypothetical protein M1820_009489 [Bogoriella megaspora]|nr:MAG: hypothetical protein M1820_009489 [Bogoriella megaspora]